MIEVDLYDHQLYLQHGVSTSLLYQPLIDRGCMKLQPYVSMSRQHCQIVNEYTGWAKNTGLFLRVDNFAKVGGRNACDMSKFSKFYPEKNIKLAYQCVKYSLLNLHKYSMSLKLR